MKQLVKQVYRSKFIRNVTVLTAGTFTAQLIPLLMLPVFARMFSASVFGIQGLLQMGATLLVPIATGYYEWSIPTPRQTHRARGLASLALFLTLIISFLSLIAVMLVRKPLIRLLNIPEIGDWMYVYPLMTLGLALIAISNYWLLRAGRYNLQSINKLAVAGATALITLSLGLLQVPNGLLFGLIGGILVGASWAVLQARRNGFELLWAGHGYFPKLAKKYKQFPLYGSLPTVVNNLATHTPLLTITATYALAVAGHYSVARNILSGGVSMLALCTGQVILKHMSDLLQRGVRVWPYYCMIMAGTAAFGICLSAAVYVIGPWFFHLYLGHGWDDSARIARILSIIVPFWMLGPTVSLALVAVHRLRAIAIWQYLYGALACSLLLFIHLPFEQFLWRIVAVEITAYALYAIIVTYAMWRYDQEQKAVLAPTVS